MFAQVIALALLSTPAGQAAPADNASRLDAMLAAMRGEETGHDSEIDERMRAEAEAYMVRVEAAIIEIPRYRPDTRTGSWSDFEAILARLDDWAGLIATGDTHALDAAQLARREALVRQVSRAQVRLFPQMRRGLGEIEGIRDGVHCDTTADRDLVAICSGERLQRQSEVRRFQYYIRGTMRKLRFRQAIYQPFGSQPHNYYSDTFEPLADGAVVIWNASGRYVEIG